MNIYGLVHLTKKISSRISEDIQEIKQEKVLEFMIISEFD
jgi:hypothetical protein